MTNAICVDSHTALSDAKITSSMICATNKDMGMCNHDSGGPLATSQWESARPNLDLTKIEARSEVSA